MSQSNLSLFVERGAEMFSFLSHLAGILAALAGTTWLVMQAQTTAATASFAVYGFTLVSLFLASTMHHAVQSAAGSHSSGIMRRLDHVSIYLFIAGTYTPVCILGIGGTWGTVVLAVVWLVALAGILLKLFAPFTPRWLTAGIYVGMGWIAVVAVKPLLDAFSLAALGWLLAGGVVYTVGAVGYARRKPDLWPEHVGFHGVWHIMVLVAAALHYVFMARFVA